MDGGLFHGEGDIVFVVVLCFFFRLCAGFSIRFGVVYAAGAGLLRMGVSGSEE